jgi:hypothetical protein
VLVGSVLVQLARRGVIVSILLVVTACGEITDRSELPTLAVGGIDLGVSSGVAWIDENRVAVSRAADPEDPASPFELAILDLRTRDWERLDLPELEGCQKTEYLGPETLPDGRLGALRRCVPSDLTADDAVWLVVVDVESLEVSALTPDLATGHVTNVSSYSWSRDMSDALVSIGSRICQTIQQVTDAGLRPIDLTVTADGGSFNLADMPDPGGAPCERTGQADDPGFSPTEDLLAFTASVAAIDVEGPKRLDMPFNVYLIRDPGAEPVPVIADVQDPSALRFAPSGECFAFGGTVPGEGSGTFAYDIGAERPTKLSDTAVSPAWSPDSSSIAGVVMTGLGPDAQEWLVVFDAGCG